jgi:glutamate-1-semialdehyde aminotransferase
VADFTQTEAWLSRARRVIPLGTQTMSKTATQFMRGVTPLYLSRGEGAHVWDVDGNEFLDYPMALGPVLLGYRDPQVDAAIRAQLDDGIVFTLPHPIEVEVAERIVDLCPGVEAVRFAKSGSDALSAAVRAARAITGRSHVVTSGYHGWHDWYIGATTRRLGVPRVVQELTTTVPFGDLNRLEAELLARPTAAVILEPSGAVTPPPGYLEDLIRLAHDHGALVVFDEIITGFRLAPGGARQRYGVTPDLSCYGKALGNGMPISAVAGAWSIMESFEEVFFSGTHGGEALSLAAACAVLDRIADGTVLAEIEARGRTLRDGMKAVVDAAEVSHRVSVSGEPQRSVVQFAGDEGLVDKSFVQQEFARRGILFNGSMFVCARHSDEDVSRTLEVFADILDDLAGSPTVRGRLVGPPMDPVFREP